MQTRRAKPGGREAALLRRLFSQGTARLEITLAGVTPGGSYHSIRGVGIDPDPAQSLRRGRPGGCGRGSGGWSLRDGLPFATRRYRAPN